MTSKNMVRVSEQTITRTPGSIPFWAKYSKIRRNETEFRKVAAIFDMMEAVTAKKVRGIKVVESYEVSRTLLEKAFTPPVDGSIAH